MKITQIALAILFCFQVSSEACERAHASAPRGLTAIKEIVSRYKAASSVSVDVKKKVLLALLDDEKQSSGKLLLSGGRLRLEIFKPDPSLVVVDKKTIWIETPASKELGTKPQVLKIKSQSIDKRSKAPLAMLLGDDKVWDEYKVKDQKLNGAVTEYSLEPKNKDDANEVVLISLKLDEKEKLIRLISYQDDVGNQTTFQFENENFGAKISDQELQYLPPKGAEITEY